jgi:hypothetical protein
VEAIAGRSKAKQKRAWNSTLGTTYMGYKIIEKMVVEGKETEQSDG